MSAATASAKKITVKSTAGTRHAEYNPISDSYLRANPKSVLTALIHGMNAHCADMLITMLDIMADKYGHDVNDLIDAVKGDDRWKAVTAHPVLNSLGYFDQEDADRVIGKKTSATKTAEELHDEVKPAKAAKPAAPVEEAAAVAEPEAKPKKATKKAAAAAAAAAETPVEEVAEPEAKPKKTTKKAAAAAEAPAEEAEVKPKKTTKKAAAAAEAPAEEAEAKPKKTTKKAAAAATPDAVVDALTESVAKMTTEEADETPAPAKKKVVSKKPVVKSA